MATRSIGATLSGTVLASVLYEQAECFGDMEGLLLGKVASQVHDTISDSQINNVKVETNIYIYRSCSFTKLDSFHDKKCQILQEKLDSTIPEGYQLVGWFHSRRNSSPRISLKESNIHRNLLSILPTGMKDNFLFLLFNIFHTDNLSTHTVDYNFYQYNLGRQRFQRVPVAISNLGDTTHTEYRTEETNTMNIETGIFASIVEKHEEQFLDKAGVSMEVNKVKLLSDSLQKELKSLTAKLHESEECRQKLEEDITTMKNLKASKLEQKRQSNSVPLKLDVGKCEESNLTSSKPKPTYEESVSIAKQKRETRRREVAKASLTLRQKSLNKNKSDSMPSHSRRLSSDEHYEKDLIALDIENERREEHSEKDIAVVVKNNQEEVKKSEKVDNIIPKMEFSFTSSSQESLILIPDVQTDSSSEAVLESKVDNTKKRQDHFSFIEDMLAEAKSKPNTRGGKQSEKETNKGVNENFMNSTKTDKGRGSKSSEKSVKSQTKKTDNINNKDNQVTKKGADVDQIQEDSVLLKDCRVQTVAEREQNGHVSQNKMEDITFSSSPVF